MTKRPLLRVAACAVAAALVLTACRGGDGGGGDLSESDDRADHDIRGITEEPCPEAVNPDNGCIYLGAISDLTVGPFAPLGPSITDAQEAFWAKVNAEGGVGGYDINLSSNIADAEYQATIHAQKYQEMSGEIAGLAQTLGSSQTLAILEDMKNDKIIGAPASWNSAWDFEDQIVNTGASYCFEAMNGVDWAVAERGVTEKVIAVGYAGDYGGDAAVGVEAAAEANDLEYVQLEAPPGADNQAGTVSQILGEQPDLVFVTTGPAELAAIVGGLAQNGFQGTVVGSSPTWNPGLLQSPAAPALEAMYFQAGPWGPWSSDTEGHQAMRDALGDVTPNDGYTAGWAWSYVMLQVLKDAAELPAGITRDNMVKAAGELSEVDYQGMLPAEAGATDGDPNEVAFRESVISGVDPAAPSGVSIVQDFTAGPTASDYDYTEPCFSLQ